MTNSPALVDTNGTARCAGAGEVEDARPHIAAAAVYVAPLRVGGGTRFKLLEAMAMRKAIVTTALGCEDNGKLAGYGVIRKCRRGYKIGPLFADREEIAETLFLALTGRIPGEEFFLDIPEPNAAAGSLVRRHNMQSVFETARMYSGAVPSLPLERIFGVTSFELG